MWQVRGHMHARCVIVNQLTLLLHLPVKGCERTLLFIKTLNLMDPQAAAIPGLPRGICV